MNLDSESQKIGICMFQIHNLGLFRADVQPQALFQPCSCRFKQLHRIAVLSAKDFEIISISKDPPHNCAQTIHIIPATQISRKSAIQAHYLHTK